MAQGNVVGCWVRRALLLCTLASFACGRAELEQGGTTSPTNQCGGWCLWGAGVGGNLSQRLSQGQVRRRHLRPQETLPIVSDASDHCATGSASHQRHVHHLYAGLQVPSPHLSLGQSLGQVAADSSTPQTPSPHWFVGLVVPPCSSSALPHAKLAKVHRRSRAPHPTNQRRCPDHNLLRKEAMNTPPATTSAAQLF